jgi:hypothetical protein
MKISKQRFKLSDLVDRERYFYFTVAGLFGIIVFLVIILLADSGGTDPLVGGLTTPAASETAQAGSGSLGITTPAAGLNPPASLPEPAQSAFAQVLLSSEDMNAVLDIWSSESTDILVQPRVEYNLDMAAGRTFVTRSKDFQLSLEVYHFSGDRAMALKVSNALKQIYLEELDFINTELACTPKTPESSWIIENQKDKRVFLGRIAGSNFVGVQLFSEAAFDKDNAAHLMCSVAERQLEALRVAGYLPEGENSETLP